MYNLVLCYYINLQKDNFMSLTSSAAAAAAAASAVPHLRISSPPHKGAAAAAAAAAAAPAAAAAAAPAVPPILNQKEISEILEQSIHGSTEKLKTLDEQKKLLGDRITHINNSKQQLNNAKMALQSKSQALQEATSAFNAAQKTQNEIQAKIQTLMNTPLKSAEDLVKLTASLQSAIKSTQEASEKQARCQVEQEATQAEKVKLESSLKESDKQLADANQSLSRTLEKIKRIEVEIEAFNAQLYRRAPLLQDPSHYLLPSPSPRYPQHGLEGFSGSYNRGELPLAAAAAHPNGFHLNGSERLDETNVKNAQSNGHSSKKRSSEEAHGAAAAAAAAGTGAGGGAGASAGAGAGAAAGAGAGGGSGAARASVSSHSRDRDGDADDEDGRARKRSRSGHSHHSRSGSYGSVRTSHREPTTSGEADPDSLTLPTINISNIDSEKFPGCLFHVVSNMRHDEWEIPVAFSSSLKNQVPKLPHPRNNIRNFLDTEVRQNFNLTQFIASDCRSILFFIKYIEQYNPNLSILLPKKHWSLLQIIAYNSSFDRSNNSKYIKELIYLLTIGKKTAPTSESEIARVKQALKVEPTPYEIAKDRKNEVLASIFKELM